MNNGDLISAFLAVSEGFLCGTQRVDDDTRRQPQPMPAPTRDTTTLRLVRTGGGAAHVWDDVSGRAAGRYTTVLVRDARQERAMASYNGEER